MATATVKRTGDTICMGALQDAAKELAKKQRGAVKQKVKVKVKPAAPKNTMNDHDEDD